MRIYFSAQTTDKYFNDIAVTVSILFIDMLGQYCFGYHFIRMHQQVFKYFIFIGGQVNFRFTFRWTRKAAAADTSQVTIQ